LKTKGFKNCGILVLGVLLHSTPYRWDFRYHDYVIFDLYLLV